MTFRLVLTKKDPRQTDFVFVSDHGGRGTTTSQPIYTSSTTLHTGGHATTTVTRTDLAGDSFQIGVIEWPVHPLDRERLVVGTRDVRMSKSGIFTSPERFMAADGYTYEWQIRDARAELVPLRRYNHPSTPYVATFVQSTTGFGFWRKFTSSLFIPPEGFPILDDIVVTFIYFESKWQAREGARSRASMSGPV